MSLVCAKPEFGNVRMVASPCWAAAFPPTDVISGDGFCAVNDAAVATAAPGLTNADLLTAVISTVDVESALSRDASSEADV
jgi:hypothetical protein